MKHACFIGRIGGRGILNGRQPFLKKPRKININGECEPITGDGLPPSVKVGCSIKVAISNCMLKVFLPCLLAKEITLHLTFVLNLTLWDDPILQGSVFGSGIA